MTYTILQAELAHGPCPACGQPISYDYAVDNDELQKITLSAAGIADTQVDATVVGVRINHDCIPTEERHYPDDLDGYEFRGGPEDHE